MTVDGLKQSAALGDLVATSLLRRERLQDALEGAPYASMPLPPKMAGVGTCQDCYA